MIITLKPDTCTHTNDFTGGTAGLTLTTRISEINQTVLVLEAAPSSDNYGAPWVLLESLNTLVRFERQGGLLS